MWAIQPYTPYHTCGHNHKLFTILYALPMSNLYSPENLNVTPLIVQPKQSLIVLGAVRDEQGRILVAKRIDRSVPDAVGRWEFVGGRIQFGEDPEVALAREVEEESGLRISIQRLLPKVFTHVWDTDEGKLQVLLLTYECAIVSGQLSNSRVSDEIGELTFLTKEEIKGLPALPNVYEALQYL